MASQTWWDARREREMARLKAIGYFEPDYLRNLPPLIRSLVGQLPPPGTDWPISMQQKWLKSMSYAFDMIYGEVEEIEIQERDKP